MLINVPSTHVEKQGKQAQGLESVSIVVVVQNYPTNPMQLQSRPFYVIAGYPQPFLLTTPFCLRLTLIQIILTQSSLLPYILG